MSELDLVFTRLSKLRDHIDNENPKDKWILISLEPKIVALINSGITNEEEIRIAKAINNIIDAYEFRFNKKFEILEKLDKQLRSQIEKGARIETEHTNDILIALKIALDHIEENPEYYDKLAAAGLEEQVEFCPQCLSEYITKCWSKPIEEAEYKGRTVPLGKPMKGDKKKFKVYVKNQKGNVVKVEFGQPGVKIKKNNPARRRSFRARHHCDTNPGPRWKARYWSCRKW